MLGQRPRDSADDYQVYVCHRGQCKAVSRCRLVGICVHLGEKIFRWPATTFARLTKSQGISQAIAYFHHFNFRSMRVIRTSFNFHVFETLFYRITVSVTKVIKISPGGESAGRVVNFEIHLCTSVMNSDCIWQSISNQYVQMQIEPGVNSDLGNGSFWVEICDAKHVDQCRSTYRSTQVGRSILV